MERPKTERLLALLRAQRAEAAVRARLTQNSSEWVESSERLDELNDRIMHDDLSVSNGTTGHDLDA